MNTWELVKCPDNVVPIPNKWVLVRKYNKAGKLVKYKERLVVKGCAQCPGFNYDQTFVPVVRLETIQAIYTSSCANERPKGSENGCEMGIPKQFII